MFNDAEVVHVDRIKSFFHGCHVDLVGGIAHVPGGAGVAPRHTRVGNDSDGSFFVDEVWADHKLPGFLVDHAVGGGTSDAFGANDLLEVGGDLVELVGGAHWFVGSIGDDP
jgi:hypothetical protein